MTSDVPVPFAVSTAPTSVYAPEDDELPQPDLQFTTVPALITHLDNISDDTDAVTVAGITPAAFDGIDRALEKRGRKSRLHYFKEHNLLVITLPNRPHEHLHLALNSEVEAAVRSMGLRHAWFSTGASRFPGSDMSQPHTSSSQGEGDSGGTPLSGDDAQESWPTIVFEAGYTQSLESLRAKMRFWLSQSAHRVKIVVLAKAFPRDRTKRILLEQWQERVTPDRPGPTTRHMARETHQPTCIQTINIAWAVPRVPYEEASRALRREPQSFKVVRGPLCLEFARLFLRQPAAPTEHDIVLSDDFLRLYATMVWRFS